MADGNEDARLGRLPATGHAQLKHGLAEPKFRFSRMGPGGTGLQQGEVTRVKLAAAMTAGSSLDGSIPSGFTYLGQFIDHDLTFDRTNVMFDTDVSPAQMLQGRSPTVDLDSLYGAGPSDPGSVQFYSDGVHLETGDSMASGGEAAFPGHDLPRAGKGTAKAKRVAVIPDPRNDENLAVAQTHVMFIRFHNRVVDTLPSTPASLEFTRAREKVTRHHQWMIRHDFLPRICDSSILDDVFTNGRKVFEVGVDPTSMPTMPVEFSIAAYRLGHSMVRSAYNWNKDFDNHSGTLDYLFEFTALSGDLGGSPRLISPWVADFRRLYDFSEAGRADLVVPPAKFNHAHRIDTRLSPPLATLPAGALPAPPTDPEQTNLAYRNLTRAFMVKLATGQQMVALLKSKGVTVTALTDAQIRDGAGGADLGALTKTQRARVLADTPLWFYILREAELNGGKLTGVGGRIVAETFHRAIEGSKFSIIRAPNFTPTLGPDAATFRMVDLILFACNGQVNQINPLGN
jgi:hypothetical protein